MLPRRHASTACPTRGTLTVCLFHSGFPSHLRIPPHTLRINPTLSYPHSPGPVAKITHSLPHSLTHKQLDSWRCHLGAWPHLQVLVAHNFAPFHLPTKISGQLQREWDHAAPMVCTELKKGGDSQREMACRWDVPGVWWRRTCRSSSTETCNAAGCRAGSGAHKFSDVSQSLPFASIGWQKDIELGQTWEGQYLAGTGSLVFL